MDGRSTVDDDRKVDWLDLVRYYVHLDIYLAFGRGESKFYWSV